GSQPEYTAPVGGAPFISSSVESTLKFVNTSCMPALTCWRKGAWPWSGHAASVSKKKMVVMVRASSSVLMQWLAVRMEAAGDFSVLMSVAVQTKLCPPETKPMRTTEFLRSAIAAATPAGSEESVAAHIVSSVHVPAALGCSTDLSKWDTAPTCTASTLPGFTG